MFKRSDYTSMDDLQLVELARDGDRSAADVLTGRYYRLAIKIAWDLLDDRDLAVEAAHEAFLKAFRALDTFNGPSFMAWFRVIVKNHSRDMLRRAKYRRSSEYDDGYVPGPHDASESPTERAAAREEYMNIVYEAYAALSPDHKEVLRLHVFEGLPYAEIARQLAIPVGTVMSRLYHARKNIKQYIEKYSSSDTEMS